MNSIKFAKVGALVGVMNLSIAMVFIHSFLFHPLLAVHPDHPHRHHLGSGCWNPGIRLQISSGQSNRKKVIV